MGLSRDQLASVEALRVPLRFWPAIRACEALQLSQRWLATGAGQKEKAFTIGWGDPSSSKITERKAFSVAFKANAESYSEAELILGGGQPFEEIPDAPADLRPGTLDKLNAANHGRDMQSEISLWGRLRIRLLTATHNLGRGSRSDLARLLDVSRQAVSDWLSGLSSPGAEKTLLLLEWVKVVEADLEKKSAGSALTPPAQTTRKDKSKVNEKVQPSRPKG